MITNMINHRFSSKLGDAPPGTDVGDPSTSTSKESFTDTPAGADVGEPTVTSKEPKATFQMSLHLAEEVEIALSLLDSSNSSLDDSFEHSSNDYVPSEDSDTSGPEDESPDNQPAVMDYSADKITSIQSKPKSWITFPNEREDKEPIKYGCDDHWTWNRHDRSHEVRLYGTGMRVAHFHPNWSSGTAGVRGTRILNNGRYYWEMQVSQRVFGTSMMFGIGTKKACLHRNAFTNLIGEDDNSWGLSHKGLIWHGGLWAQYTIPFRENQATAVGILFDGVEGSLTFYKDGKCLGVAFKDLHQVREPLYPMVCSTACKTEMTLTYMRRDFVNLQDRCRAVILESVQNKKDLENLEIPPMIRNYLAEAISRKFVPVNYYVLNV